MSKLRVILLSLYVLVELALVAAWLTYRLQPRDRTIRRAAELDPIEYMQSWYLRRKLQVTLTTPPPSDDVVVVSCGWRARKVYGPLPWPRDFFAALIDKLRSLGVKTIVMDPIFADPNRKFLAPAAFSALFPDLPLSTIQVVNPHNYVNELASRLRQARLGLTRTYEGTPQQLQAKLTAFDRQRDQLLLLARGIARGDGSRAFERVVAKQRDIVFPTDYSNRPKFAASKLGAKLFAKYALAHFEGQQSVKSYQKVLTIYPRLMQLDPIVGINGVDPWQPHFVTYVRALVRYQGRVYPASIVQGVAHHLGVSAKVLEHDGRLVLVLGKRRITLDPDGTFPLLYYNTPPARRFPAVLSGIQILRGKVPRAKLAGKLAIVDIRTPSLTKELQYPTPLAQASWASEIKATFASNLLEQHRGPTVNPRSPGWLLAIEGGLILVMGLVFAWLGMRRSFGLSIGTGLAALVLIVLADLLLATVAALLFITVILASGILSFLFTTISLQYERQHGERQRVRDAFGHYLPQAVLEHMLSDKDALVLGGRRRNLSILFSDIRGFTTVSERSNPEDLGEALNVHLTALTEAVFDNHGTLDKYMGDCVMAFFGAPGVRERHAVDSVRAALAMHERLRGIQHVWNEKCGSNVAIGVGVASGDVIVGNMGSVKLFDYTVIGDNVNLASRLEGLTKVYGVDVLVSDQTYAQSKDVFTYLEVDIVRVKGKDEPVSIFEVVCEGQPDEARAAYDQSCAAGVVAYRARDWAGAQAAFEQAQKQRPAARLPRLYLERIGAMQDLDLPPDWDGVTAFTHK